MDAVLVTLANLFLGRFALDTGLSLLDEALCAALGGHPLALVRNPVALLVLLASLPLWLLMLLSPRIPRGPFVPLALFSPLYVPLGLPLAYAAGWLTGEDAWQLSLLQAAAFAWAAALLQARGGRPWLRLAAQQDLLTYCPGLYVVHADVDLSDLHPQTVGILRHAERLLDLSHLDLAAVQDYLEWSSGLGAQEQEIFWEDVIDRRHAEVLANLDAMLSQAWPEVVIPWGAGHMPDLDAAVRARGFTPQHEVRHRLVAWGW